RRAGAARRHFRYATRSRLPSLRERGFLMPSSWLPILNTVLPYLTSIITAAVPAFTARKDNEKSANLVADQIAELQSAVTRNAESVRVLAEQMQRTIEAIQTAA